MAAGDLALRVLVSADIAQASGAMAMLGGSMLRLGETGLSGIGRGLSNLIFGFNNLGTAGTIGMDAIQQGAVQAGNAFFKLGLALTSIGVIAALALGGIAVHAAGDFEQATNTLITSAGLSKNSIDAVRQGILQLSITTGTGTDQLIKGMFNVQSALHLGVGGLQVLKAAAEGAKAENSDLAQTTDVLTTAMVNYHISASQAVPTMNSLIVTVANGKMHMDELTGALRNVLPVSAAFHIHLSDVEGALSTMANAGDRGTMAGTHLAMMFKMLENPASTARKEMTSMGIDSIKLAQTMNTSLPDALKMIQGAVAQHFTPGSVEYNRAIQTILGGSKSGVAGLEIFNQGLAALGKNTAGASAALQRGGKDVENWSTIQSGFNFKMDQAKNAVGALFIKIGMALLPVITNLVGQITPLIVSFTNWLTTGNRLQNIIGAVVNVITFLVNTIKTMISIGSAVVSFFQNNEIALDLLKATLIVAAVIIGVVMAIAFYSMAAAAWAAAAGVIAATWPLLLIIAIVIIVVAAIILAVQHWGQIVAWLKGVWGAVAGWFGNVFSAIGTTIRNALTGIKNFFGNIFSAIGATVHNAVTGIGGWFSWLGTQARQKWNDLVNGIKGIVTGIGSWLKNAWQNIVNTVVGWFLWLYNHNYYFKALVDSIINIFTQMKAWVINLWTTVVNWIVEKWNGLKEKTSEIFSAIGTTIRTILTGIKNFFGNIFDWLGTKTHDALTAIKNFVGNIFSQIGTVVHDKIMALAIWMYGIWEQIKSNVVSKVTDLKNMVGNAFSALGTDVHNKVTGLWNWLVGFANGWPAQAFNWGKNLIQGIINGIMNMIGAVKNAVGQVAGTIGNFLGFHSPAKEGPGREADKWAPAFINMYVAGLHAGMPKVNAALTQLTTPTTNKNAFALQGGSSSGGGSGGYGVMNLQINLDGKVLTEVVSVRMAKETRINGYRSR